MSATVGEVVPFPTRLSDLDDSADLLAILAAIQAHYATNTGGAYVHTQSSASSTWTVNHNLGTCPDIRVVDSAGTLVYGDVLYQSPNTAILTFSAAFAGKAYVSG